MEWWNGLHYEWFPYALVSDCWEQYSHHPHLATQQEKFQSFELARSKMESFIILSVSAVIKLHVNA
jgi:hypothetical protein